MNTIKELRTFLSKYGRKDHLVYVGIDPGVSGAIGIIMGKRVFSMNIPVKKIKVNKKNRKIFDHDLIIKIFDLLEEYEETMTVMLETGQLLWNTAFASFSIGVSYGMWPLFLKSKGFNFKEVVPQVWKKQMGLISKKKGAVAKKEQSRTKALKLFPELDLKFKKDHDRAEAILLAVYARHLDKGAWNAD
jgi:crossover junction endodeoxyribonuclease RuvC